MNICVMKIVVLNMIVFGVPLLVLAFILTFVTIHWVVMALKKTEDTRGKHSDIQKHNRRIYRDFEFFIKVFMAITAGFGYIKFNYATKNPELARQALIGLGALAMLTMKTLVIFIACHQGSKIRRWKKEKGVEWDTMIFWQEIWMILSMYLLASALWVAAFKW
jgi:hypothetical protein